MLLFRYSWSLLLRDANTDVPLIVYAELRFTFYFIPIDYRVAAFSLPIYSHSPATLVMSFILPPSRSTDGHYRGIAVVLGDLAGWNTLLRHVSSSIGGASTVLSSLVFPTTPVRADVTLFI